MNDHPSMLIVGTGALATLFAARLSASGEHITMLGTWQAGLAALRQHGARLSNADGSEQAFHVQVSDDPAACRGAREALVLVKSWQTERAAVQLEACLAQDGVALTLQNGLGNHEILARVLGMPRVALGMTTSGATLLAPGIARPGGEGVITVERHPRLSPLDKKLQAAGFIVNIVEDAQSLLWGKLIVNAAINPLTALLKIPNGELLERPAARDLMARLARESAQVAAAQNIKLPFEDSVLAAEDIARRTAANRSSMFQDINRRAPTEIDAICGAITRLGEQHGISTPVNRVCWQMVRSVVQGY